MTRYVLVVEFDETEIELGRRRAIALLTPEQRSTQVQVAIAADLPAGLSIVSVEEVTHSSVTL
jgi:hypothetical protein